MTVPATLTAADAARREWDAVAVGAGPAGALAARELARRGRAILLVDREAFPRGKVCGCCLSRAGLAALRRSGLGGLAAACGARPLEVIRLAAAGGWAELPLPGGVVLSREALDAALVRAAVRAGAHFLPRTTAALGPLREHGREVRLEQAGAGLTAVAHLVLAADGLGGRLLGRARLGEAAVAPGARVGAGAVAPAAPAFYRPGTVYMACGAGGYLGLVRLEDGRLDLAAAFDRVRVRRLGGPGPAAAALLHEAGWPAPALDPRAWRGTPALTRRLARPAAARVFALGDAAGYVEPFTGEGIGWALSAAVAVAPLADRASRRWNPALEREWASAYARVVRRRQLACRAAAAVLRRPRLAGALVRLLARAPRLAGPVVRRLGAPAPLPTPA
jgi:flavin-dependent dehydrogenase